MEEEEEPLELCASDVVLGLQVEQDRPQCCFKSSSVDVSDIFFNFC